MPTRKASLETRKGKPTSSRTKKQQQQQQDTSTNYSIIDDYGKTSSHLRQAQHRLQSDEALITSSNGNPTTTNTTKIYGTLRGPAPQAEGQQQRQPQPQRTVSCDLSLISASSNDTYSVMSDRDMGLHRMVDNVVTTHSNIHQQVQSSRPATFPTATTTIMARRQDSKFLTKRSGRLSSSKRTTAAETSPSTVAPPPVLTSAKTARIRNKGNTRRQKGTVSTPSKASMLSPRPPTRSLSPPLYDGPEEDAALREDRSSEQQEPNKSPNPPPPPGPPSRHVKPILPAIGSYRELTATSSSRRNNSVPSPPQLLQQRSAPLPIRRISPVFDTSSSEQQQQPSQQPHSRFSRSVSPPLLSEQPPSHKVSPPPKDLLQHNDFEKPKIYGTLRGPTPIMLRPPHLGDPTRTLSTDLSLIDGSEAGTIVVMSKEQQQQQKQYQRQPSIVSHATPTDRIDTDGNTEPRMFDNDHKRMSSITFLSPDQRCTPKPSVSDRVRNMFLSNQRLQKLPDCSETIVTKKNKKSRINTPVDGTEAPIATNKGNSNKRSGRKRRQDELPTNNETTDGSSLSHPRMLHSDHKRISSITLLSPDHQPSKASVSERVKNTFLSKVPMPDCVEVDSYGPSAATINEIPPPKLENETTAMSSSSTSTAGTRSTDTKNSTGTATTGTSKEDSITMASPSMATIPEVKASTIHLKHMPGSVKEEDYFVNKERLLEIVGRSVISNNDENTSDSAGGNSDHESSNSNYGVNQARQEALRYAMFGHDQMQQQLPEMGSVATPSTGGGTTESSSNSNSKEDSGTEQVFPPQRRISSITFLSNRAPFAPGETRPRFSGGYRINPGLSSIPPSRDDNNQAHISSGNRIKLVGKLEKKHLSEKATMRNKTMDNDNRPPKPSPSSPPKTGPTMMIRDARMPDCIEVQLDDGHIAYAQTDPDESDRSYQTRSGSTVRVNPTPSIAMIPETDGSGGDAVPPPRTTLQRQPEVSITGAWTFPGRIFRSIVSRNSSGRGEGGADHDDRTTVSQASQGTVRSLISATWAIVVPTRRLESVQPIAVKHADDVDTATTTKACFVCCTLGTCGIILIAVIAAIAVVSMGGGGGGSPDDSTSVLALTPPTPADPPVSDPPTFSPFDGVIDPDLPEKPEITIPPRSGGTTGDFQEKPYAATPPCSDKATEKSSNGLRGGGQSEGDDDLLV